MSVNGLENQSATVTLALIIYRCAFLFSLFLFLSPFKGNTQVLLFIFQRTTLWFFFIFSTLFMEKLGKMCGVTGHGCRDIKSFFGMKEFCAQRVKISIFYTYFLEYLEDRSFLEETDSIFRYNALDLFFHLEKLFLYQYTKIPQLMMGLQPNKPTAK